MSNILMATNKRRVPDFGAGPFLVLGQAVAVAWPALGVGSGEGLVGRRKVEVTTTSWVNRSGEILFCRWYAVPATGQADLAGACHLAEGMRRRVASLAVAPQGAGGFTHVTLSLGEARTL